MGGGQPRTARPHLQLLEAPRCLCRLLRLCPRLAGLLRRQALLLQPPQLRLLRLKGLAALPLRLLRRLPLALQLLIHLPGGKEGGSGHSGRFRRAPEL